MNVIKKFITPNKYSRPQKQINRIKGLVIHWVANPNSSAMKNVLYFENRKYGKDDYGSAHEIIDLNGDIIVCIPENEISYNCGSKSYTKESLSVLGSSPNYYTYSIECTHIDWDGKMTNETYKALIERCVFLCKKFNLNPLTDIWLHKEVVGWKDCHKWFVNYPNEWKSFKMKVYQDLKKTEIQQWKIDAVKYLKDNDFIKGNHETDDEIDLLTFAYIYNNYEMQDPMQYLVDRGFLKRKPRNKYHKLTWRDFSILMMNKNKVKFLRNPIKYLLKSGFITTDKNPYEKITFAYLGAMFKNYFSKNNTL